VTEVRDERNSLRNPVLKEARNLVVRFFGLLSGVVGQVLSALVEVNLKVFRLNVEPLLVLVVDLVFSESEILRCSRLQSCGQEGNSNKQE